MSNYKLSNRLVFAYRTAMSQGKWQNTYAATNSREYWAVGVLPVCLVSDQWSPTYMTFLPVFFL